jgi:hypothetical protein
MYFSKFKLFFPTWCYFFENTNIVEIFEENIERDNFPSGTLTSSRSSRVFIYYLCDGFRLYSFLSLYLLFIFLYHLIWLEKSPQGIKA